MDKQWDTQLLSSQHTSITQIIHGRNALHDTTSFLEGLISNMLYVLIHTTIVFKSSNGAPDLLVI